MLTWVIILFYYCCLKLKIWSFDCNSFCLCVQTVTISSYVLLPEVDCFSCIFVWIPPSRLSDIPSCLCDLSLIFHFRCQTASNFQNPLSVPTFRRRAAYTVSARCTPILLFNSDSSVCKLVDLFFHITFSLPLNLLVLLLREPRSCVTSLTQEKPFSRKTFLSRYELSDRENNKLYFTITNGSMNTIKEKLQREQKQRNI